MCGEQFECRFAGPAPPNAIRNVGTGAPSGHELADDFRRILEVGVDKHDCVASRVFQSSGQRTLVAKISRQRHDADGRIGRRQGPKQR